MFARGVGALLACACLSGCGTAPPANRPVAPLAPPAFQVAKLREDLQVAPLEVVFSGVRGQLGTEESIGIRNVGAEPVSITGLRISGPQADSFRLVDPPSLPLVLPPSRSLAVTVAVAPPPEAAPGVHRAMVHILQGTNQDEGPPVDLSALLTASTHRQDEPSLRQIVEALGFSSDVDGKGSPGEDGESDQVSANRFQRSRPTPVSLYPVARYGSEGRIPYGYASGPDARITKLAVVSKGNHQTLNPDLEPDAKTTFDPGAEPFALYIERDQRRIFSDGAPRGASARGVRVFALESRGGARIPDAYLIAFDEDGDGDHNDQVFVIWNVRPTPR